MRRLLRPEWIIALLFVGVAAIALGYRLLVAPTSLTIAVASPDAPAIALVETLARVFTQQKSDLSLHLVKSPGEREAAAALERKAVDFAVVRPDVAFPENGMTVAILEEHALVIAVPASAGIEDVAGLARKRLGFVAREDADRRLLDTVLAAEDLAPPALTLVALTVQDVEAAFREKRIDALGMIAPLSDPALAGALKALGRASGGKFAVLGVENADALALKSPVLATIDIPAGALGGRPRQPEEETKTIGVTRRLVARADLSPATVAETTQYLFEWRPRIARVVPGANAIKAPESTMSAVLPVHPGAIQYLEREQLTFFERYGDWIYIGLFMGGGFFSAIAALFQRVTRRRRELVDEVLDRLLCILGEARGSTDPAELDALSVEIDGLVTHAVRYTRNRTTGTRTLSALMMALDAARAAVDERRRVLAGAAEGGPARALARKAATV
jgi:TRAP transporter TAXI family solute receptor